MLLSDDLVMETCLLAGEIMIKNGAETYRAEETMRLMARAAGMESVHSFVTPTSIIFSYRGENDNTRMIRIMERTTDLNKVTLANEVSRQFVSGRISLAEANARLHEIDRKQSIYPRWLQHLAAGIASGSFSVLLGASVFDFLVTAFCGLIVNVSASYFHRVLKVRFFAEFMSAFLGGMIVYQFFRLFPILHPDLLIIGTMIPLFPGVSVTNSLRDMMAGDFLAGISRGIEAALTALSVATASAIVLLIAR